MPLHPTAATGVVVVHGGVDMEPSPATFAALDAAAALGALTLAEHRDGLAAAVAALGVLEDDPTFNAGLGSVLTTDGLVETDGAVAIGRGRRFAAIGAMPGIRNPAAVARVLLEDGRALLLTGEGARRFALDHGFVVENLVTEEQQEALVDPATGRSVYTGRRRPAPAETIGCIVIDNAGTGFASSSTGGLRGKPAGRVGDAAVAGAGYWADERAAVLCSGAGEVAMRSMIAARVAQRVPVVGPRAAAVEAVSAAAEEYDAILAVLAVDVSTAEVGAAHRGSSFPVVLRSGARTGVVTSTPIVPDGMGA